MTKELEQQLIDTLMKSGLTEAEAREQTTLFFFNLQTLQPGTTLGGRHPEHIGQIWEQARRAGATKLTLEVSLEPDEYHISIKVLDRDGPLLRHPQAN